MRIVLRCLCLSQPSSPISCLPDRFPRKYVSSCWPVSFLEFGSGEQSHLSEIGLFFAFYIVNSSAGGGVAEGRGGVVKPIMSPRCRTTHLKELSIRVTRFEN